MVRINPHVRELAQEECQAWLCDPGWEKSGKYADLYGMTVYVNGESGVLLVVDEELRVCVAWSSAEHFEDAIGGTSPCKVFGTIPGDLPHAAGREAARLVEKACVFGVDLDFTLVSLARLDEILGEVAVADDSVIPEMFFPLVFYVGESILKTQGGRWFWNWVGDYGEPWIELDDGRVLNVPHLVYETLSLFPENPFGLEYGTQRLLEP